MSKKYGYKYKILYIYKILYEETNEHNRINAADLVKRLAALGIECERKSIYDDIETLRSFGADIVGSRGYYLASRSFENAELKILADSVAASHFITEKKSRMIIKKIAGLTDLDSAKLLRSSLYTAGTVKTTNERIYYNVDILQLAVNTKKRVSFKYFTYNIDKSVQYRNGGQPYTVSPYCLTFANDNYYLIAHNPRRKGLTHFRVDRITNVSLSPKKSRPVEEIMGADFSLSDYTKKLFSMFSGEKTTVKIKCDKSLINAVIDRFGEGVFLYPDGKDSFVFSVDINVSPTFFAWIFTFGDLMQILSPESVRDKYISRLKSILNKNMQK